ncbi:MAG: hypothetical protein CMF96_00335 [Candidatus Marinimicrobia bacterium]|nr:hypothetical protein [Candidatus Neomarinimicrobiota bacterium]|tara:strand:+ start:2002 stop:3009 length:1008 start_codon:yes stop_codon:yes gene_type:complete
MRYIVFLIISELLFSNINISGDGRFRTRFDIKENLHQNTNDLYHQYRARINIKSNIGGDWFFKSKVGTNSVAGMTKIGDSEHNGPGNENSHRPNLSFLELYFGRKTNGYGYWIGAYPLKSNPCLDLHYYPDKIVGIPWILYNNSTITGFFAYFFLKENKINTFISIDQNSTNKIEEFASSLDDIGVTNVKNDNYTIGLNTDIKKNNFVLSPYVLVSFGEGDQPYTAGIELELEKLFDIKTSISHYQTNNSDYNANHTRIKFNFPHINNKVNFFYDLALKNKKSASYLWLSYSFNIYDSDLGKLTISPTIRLQNGSFTEQDYSRSIFEVTTQIKFN